MTNDHLVDAAEHIETSGSIADAIAAWKRAVEATPTAFLWARLAGVLHASGDLDGAEAAARTSIALDQASDLGFYVLGRTLEDRGLLEPARDAYARSLALRESQPLLTIYGNVLRSLGQRALAEAALRRSVTLAPDDDDALYVLGVVLLEDRPSEAIPYLERSLQSEPDRRRIRRHLGEAYFKERRFDEALPVLQEAVVEEPDDAWSRFLLGRVLERMGDLSAAREQYLKVTELAPDASTSWAGLAGVVAKMGNAAEADRLFRKALALDPADSLVLRAYGLHLARTGFPGRAKKYLERVRTKYPDDAEIRDALKQIS